MERGDLNKTVSYLDDSVDYYAFAPKDKAFIGEQLHQYFAALPMRSFAVGDVKVQDSAKPIRKFTEGRELICMIPIAREWPRPMEPDQKQSPTPTRFPRS